jgi:hypothetical protein
MAKSHRDAALGSEAAMISFDRQGFARRQGSAHLNPLRLFTASRLDLDSGITLGRSQVGCLAS